MHYKLKVTDMYIYKNTDFLQRMRQEFRATLAKASAMASDDEPEPSTSTEPSASSPSRVLQTHCQHSADYIRFMIEEGGDLTMGEDRAAPLL